MYKVMIAGTGSGAGKTTVTIGLIKALSDRGFAVTPFKCGPDYIDTMFHRRILGIPSRNLDSVMCDEETVRFLFEKNRGEFSVIEGVMGYYDGIGNSKGSSMDIARITGTKTIIVMDCKGMSESMGAVMKGFLTYQTHTIAGFIFNRLPEVLEGQAKRLCDALGTEYFGRLPMKKEIELPSRHLGLITAGEVADWQQKVAALAAVCEEKLLIDKIIAAACVEEIRVEEKIAEAGIVTEAKKITEAAKNGDAESNEKANSQILIQEQQEQSSLVRIALADDAAFCFIYQDNLDFLERAGCQVVRFSPLADSELPVGISGLILPGGYPELYAEQLSKNRFMLESIRLAVGSVPTIAECGGFMLLHKSLYDASGSCYPMAGVINGSVHRQKRLVRFGYVKMHSEKPTLLGAPDEELIAHEFHYYDSDHNGEAFVVEKISRPSVYRQGHADENFYGGFPHLYFYGNRKAAMHFVAQCAAYHRKNEEKIWNGSE